MIAILLVGGVGAGAVALTGDDGPSHAAPDPSRATEAATASDAETSPSTSASESAPAPEPTPTPEPTPRVRPTRVVEPRLAASWEPATGELPAELTPLRARLEAVLAELAPSLEGTRLSVAVRDEDGHTVLDVGDGQRLMPASTMKVVTAASALQAWPTTHRFRTVLAPTGPVEDGVVRGDLVLVGSGDPVLTTQEYRTWVYPARPATSLEDLADAVVDAGITTIEGALIGDASGWGTSALAAGWREGYLSDQDARYITPLTVDAGLDVDVTLPEDDVPQVVLRPHRDPARRAVDTLAAMLAERGVSVRASPRTSVLPVPVLDPVAHVDSPPLGELLGWTLQRSDNHLADTLVRAAGHALTGDGSWAGAHRGAVAAVGALGIDAGPLRVADGSGLSRLDRVTAGMLAEIDAAMVDSEVADVWASAQAVTGQVGTLRRRLVGTAGEGRFLGKTGTLDDVKAVVGHVIPQTPEVDGRRLHLAVVANGVPVGGQWAVTVLMDRLQLVLVDHLDGCTTTWDEAGTPVRSCPTPAGPEASSEPAPQDEVVAAP